MGSTGINPAPPGRCSKCSCLGSGSWGPVHWERMGVTPLPRLLWFHEGKCSLIFSKDGLEHDEGGMVISTSSALGLV